MPSAPVTARTLIYYVMEDGTIIQHDWNLIETSLGTMVEPRVVNRAIPGFSDIHNEDSMENGYTAVQKLSVDALLNSYGVSGVQWPHFRTNDPATV